MRTAINVCSGTILLLMAASQIVLAGVFIEGVTTESNGKQMTHNMYVKSDRVRMELPDDNGMMVAIYRQDKDVFWMIDAAEGKYLEMTRDDLKAMRGMMDEAMKQMGEQMKALPPEQRAMMESMMAKQMPQTAKEPDITYKLIDNNVPLDHWKCDHYVGYEEGEKVMELWTVDPQDIDLDGKEFAALEAMGEFFSEFAPDENSFFEIGSKKVAKGEEGPDFYGIPVKTVHYNADGEQMTTMMGKTERQDLDNGLFEVPQGLQKEKFMDD